MIPSVRLLLSAPLLLALLANAGQSAAQPAKFDEAAALAAVDAVVSEHRIYATCLASDIHGWKLVQTVWQKEVADATDALRRWRPSPAFTARFAAATNLSKLVDPDMKLSAVMALCHANAEKLTHVHTLGYTRLAQAIDDALERSKRK